jgi:hypothetical protein
MGSELCGYHTIIPSKLTDKEKKTLHEHLDNLEKLLTTPNIAKEISEEDTANGKYLKQLNNICSYIPNEMDIQGYFGEDWVDEIQDMIDEIVSLIPMGRKFLDDIVFEGRDLSVREIKILGRRYLMIFGGDSTWGDEPEGLAYTTLKDLDKLNLLTTIEKLTIPSSNSEHFIKSCTTDSD